VSETVNKRLLAFIFRWFNERDPNAVAEAIDAYETKGDGMTPVSETQRIRQEAARDYRRIAELEATIERLKCCGNCDRWNPWDTPTSCAADIMYALGSKPCHLTPSRWAGRITP
jgi:cytosine/adenosine deaminase-related metal-dependent hydrolase